MWELNRAERRALRLATALVLTATAVRLGLGVGRPDSGWRPAAGASERPVTRVRAEVKEAVERARRAATPLGEGERIDPNVAPAEELQRLPGVGPATARAILRNRAREGPYRVLEDLLRVPGIGPARLARIAPHVALTARPPWPRTRRSPVRGPPGGGWAPGPAHRGRGAPGGRAPAGGPARGSARLDLNRATAAELERLPGIGPALARRILERRAAEGRFDSVGALRKVPGVGPVRLERLRERVRVGPPP